MDVETRVIELRAGKEFALVVSRDGEWRFTGGRVYRSREAAEAAASDEVTWLRSFWEGQLANRVNAFVVNGWHYRLGAEDYVARGFGGRRFRLRSLTTGEVVETSNLWEQGSIPDFLRPSFPNTHEFEEVDGQ